MKKLFTTLIACTSFYAVHAMSVPVAAADTMISTNITKQNVIENGGTGMYRSIVVTDKGLNGYTIYRPRDVQWAAHHEGRLPLLIWANGACGDDNSGYQNMLNHLASHGYVVIALGLQRANDNDPTGGATSEKQMIEALNWMVKQVSSKTSDYYRAVDCNNVALSGHSCGGAEAIANCGNSRVKTLLIMNAGMGGMSMGGASPASLNSLHCPIIYLTGGPDDVAYSNAQTDFNSIKKVGVVWADLSNAGHGGTYWHQHGGDFARIALKWMDWHLKGKEQNAPTFLTPDSKEFPSWNIQNHNFKAKDYMAAYDAGPTVTDTIFNHSQQTETFAFGADLSLTSKQEAGGQTYYSRADKKLDVFSILKSEGMNAVRLSVLVNPSDNYCNKSDLQKLCVRAKKYGLDIMVDFHYSDYLSNGGNQFKPAAWENHSADKLVDDVYNHTFDVLNTLKKAALNVRWVQVGNDVQYGMLWGDGRVGKSDFNRFLNSAYSAVKAVYPDAQTVLHVADGQDADALSPYFDPLLANDTHYDMIGLSAYPKWSNLKNDSVVARTMRCVTALKERYGKPVMVVETGHYNNRPLETNTFLCNLLTGLQSVGAAGLFYQSPEVINEYELGAWNPVTLQPSIALDAFMGLKHISVPYVMKIDWPLPADTICQTTEPLMLPVKASHIRNRLQQIELLSGKEVVATSEADSCVFRLENLQKGVNQLFARATSTDGVTVCSDTCNLIQGPLTVVDNTVLDTKDDKRTAQHWAVNVREAGEYMLLFKYRTAEVLSPRINVNQTRVTTLRFNVTQGKQFGYASKTITLDAPGETLISLQQATTKVTIPEIESFMLIPLNGQPLPTVADPTFIPSVRQSSDRPTVLYDLQGRRADETTKGIKVSKGKKLINK